MAPRGRGFRWDWLAAGAAAFAAFALAAFAARMAGLFDPPGALPAAIDVDAYWSAASLALQGHVRDAYNNTAIELFERAHTRISGPGYLAFYYPPSFLLLCLPLGLLPYLAGVLVFLGGQAALFWPVMRRVLVRAGGRKLGWLPVLAMPAFLMNVFAGQNGGLSACCFGGAMLLLAERPVLAGVCLGALACKPQLALTAPLALLCARRWRALASAGVTAVILAALSWLVLGQAAWSGFFGNAAAARADIELPIKWHFAQSVYTAVRLAGGSLAAGYAVQAACAALAVAVLVSTCWRRRGPAAEMATLTVTAMLVTPYLYDYDLVVIAAPMAWLCGRGVKLGFLPGEKPLLLLMYLVPYAARGVSLATSVTLAPPLLAAMLFCVWRRARLQAAG
jgi:hypothetical protein